MQQSKQLKWILILSGIVACLFIVTILIKTNEILSSRNDANASEKVKVTIITSVDIIDQSWGSLAYKGKLSIQEQFPVKVSLHSQIDTPSEKEEVILEAIFEGASIIIGHGREFSETFTLFAPNHPKVQFVTIHGTAEYENQSVYTFDQGEIEFFAALAATLKTNSNRIAILDAHKERRTNPQFEKALYYYHPDVRFFYRNVGSRDNSQRAVEMMKQLKRAGVDVVYSKGNAFNRDVIEFAKENNMYVIGYLDDQSYMAVDHVLTSVMNDVAKAYVAIMDDYFSEEGIASGKKLLTANHGVYKLAPFGPMFTEDELDLIYQEMEKYHNGELTF